MNPLIRLISIASFVSSGAPDGKSAPLFLFIRSVIVMSPRDSRTGLSTYLASRTKYHDILYEWYKMDEETFVEEARDVVEYTHATIHGTALQFFLDPQEELLKALGFSDTDIAELLAHDYYQALRNVQAFQNREHLEEYTARGGSPVDPDWLDKLMSY
jgi:hypothetical protein